MDYSISRSYQAHITQLSNINCYTKPWYAYNTSKTSNLRLKGQHLKKSYENPQFHFSQCVFNSFKF